MAGFSGCEDHINEETRLTQCHTSQGESEIYRGHRDSDYTNASEERDTNPVECEGLDFLTETYSGYSKGPESQKNSMLNETQNYGTIKIGARRPSIPNSLHLTHSTHDEHIEIKSIFLGGISLQRFWLIFGVILTSFFIACFDTTIMVSSHPVITSYFRSSNSASWLSTAFLLTATGFQPLFGGLSDTIGRKRPFLFSLAVLLVATIWCAVAQSMTSFILARALCGLGAGGLLTMSSILTSDLVPIEIRGIYQSYINVVYGFGAAAGAALGGWICDSLGWRWEFGIQVPTLIICFYVAYITLPSQIGLAEGVEKKSLLEALKVFDYQGSILLSVSTTFLILGLNLGGNIYAWTHPFVILSLIIFAISFPLFLYVESYIPNPIMPSDIIMKNPRASLIFGNFLGVIIYNGITFNVPLFFQAVLLKSATDSGLRLLVPSIASSLLGTAVGFLITWTKQLKIFLVVGVCFSLAGSVALSFLQRGWPDWVYLLFLVPSSIGQGLTYPTTFMSVLAVSPQSEQAVVTSTLMLWRSLGIVLGVSLSSLILQNSLLLYLDEKVIGPNQNQIIEAVRKSVAAIHDLNPYYQGQVRDSYAAALNLTFASTAALGTLCVALTICIKLPRLSETRKS